jgi:predicted nuclease of predicted toxin-antitoxin system
LRFLVDNQLPPALARFIDRDLEAEAVHVSDVGLRDGSDSDVWDFASTNDFILISKDEDFVTLFSSSPSAGLLWVRFGNCRRAVLLDLFQQLWPRILDRLANAIDS